MGGGAAEKRGVEQIEARRARPGHRDAAGPPRTAAEHRLGAARHLAAGPAIITPTVSRRWRRA